MCEKEISQSFGLLKESITYRRYQIFLWLYEKYFPKEFILPFCVKSNFYLSILFGLLKKYDLSYQDNFLYTSLLYSVQNQNFELTEFLIENGANINQKGFKMISPLHIACRLGNLELTKLLVSHGANINSVENNVL